MNLRRRCAFQRSGPPVLRWRTDKSAHEADTLERLRELLTPAVT
jgi:hypothetical protein